MPIIKDTRVSILFLKEINMKKSYIAKSLALVLLSVSGASFAQQAVSGQPQAAPQGPGFQRGMDRHERMEEWKNMTPAERKAKFLENANKRVDKDLQEGIITKSEAQTLRSANQIVANKVLPHIEKQREERIKERQSQAQPQVQPSGPGNSMGMPK